ncbi:hypothetical protein [Gemmiger sp.]
MVSMRSLFAYFWQDPPRVVFFAVCCALVLVLSFRRPRDTFYTKLRDQIVLPSLLLTFLFLNPVSTHFLLPLMMETRILRFFWLVPISLLLGVTSAALLTKLPRKAARVLAAVGGTALVVLCVLGWPKWARRSYSVDNWYKIPQNVVELCDEIDRTAGEADRTAVFPQPLNLWVRQYDASIRQPFAWNHVEDEMAGSRDLYTMLVLERNQPLDLTALGRQAAASGLNYIVLAADANAYGSLTESGYREIFRTEAGPEPEINIYDKAYILYGREVSE